MSPLKILITGGSGLLGQYLNIVLSNEFTNVLTLYHNNLGNCSSFNSQQIDITDSDALKNIFKNFCPDVVVHTAAISNSRKALNYTHKQIYDINVNATAQIAELCNRYNSGLIYTSTDLVYAGYRGSCLNEDSKIVPVSLYAETKLMGEEKIRLLCKKHIILRTALLFGYGLNGSENFFHFVYNSLKKGEKVKLFTDQYRSPLELKQAAEVIRDLINKSNYEVTLNYGGPERVTRYRLAEKLVALADLDSSLLLPIKMEDVPSYPKVSDVSMSIERLLSLGIKVNSLDLQIQNFLESVK